MVVAFKVPTKSQKTLFQKRINNLLNKNKQPTTQHDSELVGRNPTPDRGYLTPPKGPRVPSSVTKEDISYDLNGEVPKLYIKGQEVGVVVMTNHYVTSDYENEGVNVITFVYLIGGNPEQKVLSIDQITGEVMHQ